MIDYLEEVLDQEEEEREEPEELTGRPGSAAAPREGRAVPAVAAEEGVEQASPTEDGGTWGILENTGAEALLTARVRAAERSAAQSEAALNAAEGRTDMPVPWGEAAGDREERTEETRASELEARVRTAEQRAAESEAEAGAAEMSGTELAGLSRSGIRVYGWETSARRPGGGRALPEETGILPLEEAVTELSEAATAERADAADLLRRSGRQGAEALYAGLTRLRAAAGFSGGRETVTVSVPEAAGAVTVRTGLEAADLDRRFQRDARRYDGGFTLY